MGGDASTASCTAARLTEQAAERCIVRADRPSKPKIERWKSFHLQADAAVQRILVRDVYDRHQLPIGHNLPSGNATCSLERYNSISLEHCDMRLRVSGASARRAPQAVTFDDMHAKPGHIMLALDVSCMT